MQLTLEVKDSKVPFLIELLKNFRFVKLTPPLPEDELDDLVCLAMYGQQAMQEPQTYRPLPEAVADIEKARKRARKTKQTG